MPCGVSGHAACSSDTAGLCAPVFSTALVTPASALEDSVAFTAALGVCVDSSTIVANRSLSPTPSAAVVDSSVERRAPEDSGTESAHNVSTPGTAPGCLPVWPEGFRSSARPILHQISPLITVTIKIEQLPIPRQRYLHISFLVDGSEPALPPREPRHCSGDNPCVLG